MHVRTAVVSLVEFAYQSSFMVYYYYLPVVYVVLNIVHNSMFVRINNPLDLQEE